MPWYNVKIKGGKGVRKSSLVRKFLLGEFSEDYRGGSQIFWENASLPCVDYYYHGLIVWDGHDPQPVKRPPGIERGGRVIGGAVVVVYDITNPSSFDEAKYLVHRSWLQRHVVGLVGSKADLWMHRKIKYEVGNLGQVNYAASKAGVEGLTRSCAKELAKFGVRCNAVLPGFIETPMTEAVPEKVIEKLKKQIPMFRLGQPSDVADVVTFLASDRSSYITGASIEVTGGLFM